MTEVKSEAHKVNKRRGSVIMVADTEGKALIYLYVDHSEFHTGESLIRSSLGNLTPVLHFQSYHFQQCP
jgi:hypothetical protein